MTIQARTGLMPEWYTPVSETGAATPARFKLRPMTGPEILDLRAYYIQSTGKIMGKGALIVLSACMLDWENVSNEKGEPVQFAADNIETLPPAILNELANKLVMMSRLTETERKN